MIHGVAVSGDRRYPEAEVRTTRTALAACSKNVWPRADVAQARRRPKQPIKPAFEAVHSVTVAPKAAVALVLDTVVVITALTGQIAQLPSTAQVVVD
jgi:hypothetical protein